MIQQRLRDYFNYKRLYEQMHEKYLQEKEQRKKTQDENRQLKDENTDLKQQLKEMAEQKKARKAWFKQNYSVAGQEKTSSKQQRAVSPGRTPKNEKLKNVSEDRHVYPDGISPEQCIISHTRYVTHIRNGKTHIVHYHLWKQPWGEAPKLPGVMPRGEYGLEVAVILAFLVYIIEISTDQARSILLFFTGLNLSRSQADSLLQQLATLWKPELEKIITLLTVAYLVHIDETGWKVGKERCYTWIFTNLAHTLFLYGQSRGEETLEQVLSREFQGTVITGFFSTYEKYFSSQQKCWAHILRDAIKLMLLHPGQKKYRKFFDQLHAIFVTAKEAQKDETLIQKEREKKVSTLQKNIRRACSRSGEKIPTCATDDLRDFLNLQKRLVKYQDSLFTFVLHPEVEPTNNRAEQGLRKTAKARNNYQTSKTERGARRRSVIASVLTSLRQNLPAFSLEAVIDETQRWRIDGFSLFDRQILIARARASPS